MNYELWQIIDMPNDKLSLLLFKKHGAVSIAISELYDTWVSCSSLSRDISQLPNKFIGHFATPLEYIISLICSSLGCVGLLNAEVTT